MSEAAATASPIDAIQALLGKLDLYDRTHRLEHYQPYPWQQKYHNSIGHLTQYPAVEKAAITANQVGKTSCAGMETAMHLTGLYPDWYEGLKFSYPITWIVAGVTNETTRDILQRELFGDPRDPAQLGTGCVPLELIGTASRKAGVQDAFEAIKVRHVQSGRWSTCLFKCYEQGPKKFMGFRGDGGWLDEEPPNDILSQFRRSVFARRHSLLLLTLTAEEGMTEVVYQLMSDLKRGQSVTTATWNDAPHMTPEVREQKLATIPAHEVRLRTMGDPFMGSGLIFPYEEQTIVVDPFQIPRYWPRIIGIDFGHDHPFGAASLAWDRDTDTVYLTADYRETRALPAVHVDAIKGWKESEYAPVSWPHDGLNTEKTTGDELRESYAKRGLRLLQDRATNPPDFAQGQKEGEGGNSPETALIHMIERMETGKFKVFRTCTNWLEEKRSYHRKNGKIVKLRDDTISASRHAHMMLRHARTQSVPQRKLVVVAGTGNW